MNLKETIRLALTGLLTNKMRSFLTMLGIIIGISSVILLIAIGSGLKTYITGQLEDLGAGSLFVVPGEFEVSSGQGQQGGMMGAGATAPKFTFAQLKQLQRQGQTIKVVMPYIESNGTIKYKGHTKISQVSGVGTEYPQVRDHRLQSGAFFSASQYNSAKKVAVLGSSVAEELFSQATAVGRKITISDQRYTVIGVLAEKGAFGNIDMDNQVFIPATTAMRQFDLQYIQSFWVQSQSAETVPATKQEIETILGAYLKDDEFSIIDTKSILNVISQILGTLTLALAGIAAISLVVGGVGIMNIMLVSVTERTREIGLRKAIGATPKNILHQFLIEATVLSLVGGAAGILLGVGGALIINRFFTTTITGWSILLAFGVSSLIGIIFGVAPAAKAAKLDPIAALRYE
ncbi:multidrug ABC transporter substrate-binding protein [Candidatus Shapirobacteria bacterium CG09_land_8_20_14_0_10_49_15]|uniref:Multidrug ABC transporter substrate-binding protein n=2 Tax=Candidatus Shapironibacteriota TaxID=1752721 RepID=A0A2M8L7J1_9BACT|nr:MAG: multidrug ABC transporter substrate-binding protein [Candidatus Shapirobacteria bacterium CG09_land_8_20_14_0_10_49_15]PJE70205.1 MAG: multidrug ABC transporter substrate-binding protein [Candidatus Shapirobacteria bacterium CG10_big_fil_rev_8_21_14_0_10_48_15]